MAPLQQFGRGPAFGRRPQNLFDFDSCSGVRQFLSDRLSFFLGNAFLDGLWGRLNEVFRLFESQRSYFTDDLDDIDLLTACGLKNDVKFGLLFSRRSRLATTRSRCR